MEAYFKYRLIANPEAQSFAEEESVLLEALLTFQKNLVNWGKYSKVTWALFFKILRKCLSEIAPEVA